jgi:FkbM family methyltransferase
MLGLHCFTKILKKFLIIFIVFSIFFYGALTILSLRAGYGIGYIPTIYKSLTKDFLFRAYGPKTIPAYKFVGLYTKMMLKSLVRKKANINHEHMLGYNITYFDQVAFFSGYSEIFVKEIYHFSTTNNKPFIIDCGSNIGLATLYFKMLYPKAEIIAFEPSRKCFQVLQKNISVNNLTNVTAYNKAVSNQEGSASFWDPSEGCGDGRASILVQGNNKFITTVESVRLSDYITKPVDLLKMDIEGAEFMVFQELAQAKKLKLIKEIVLEYHHHIPNNDVDRFGKFLSLLEDNNFGYQIRGCNVGIAYQFDPKEVQLINIHAYNKDFKK